MFKIIPLVVLASLLATNIVAASEISGTLSNNPEYTQVTQTQFPANVNQNARQTIGPGMAGAVKVGIVSVFVVEVLALAVIQIRQSLIRGRFRTRLHRAEARKKEVF